MHSCSISFNNDQPRGHLDYLHASIGHPSIYPGHRYATMSQGLGPHESGNSNPWAKTATRLPPERLLRAVDVAVEAVCQGARRKLVRVGA